MAVTNMAIAPVPGAISPLDTLFMTCTVIPSTAPADMTATMGGRFGALSPAVAGLRAVGAEFHHDHTMFAANVPRNAAAPMRMMLSTWVPPEKEPFA